MVVLFLQCCGKEVSIREERGSPFNIEGRVFPAEAAERSGCVEQTFHLAHPRHKVVHG